MRYSVAIAVVCLGSIACGIASAGDNGHLLSAADALRVADAAYSDSAHRLPGFEIESTGESEHFYFYQGLWANPGPGSVLVEHIAVDKETADAWASTSACLEISSRHLRAVQNEMRRTMKMSRAAYRSKKRACPLEMGEPKMTPNNSLERTRDR